MRFATPLRTSTQRHVLSSRQLSELGAVGWFVLAIALVFGVVLWLHLDVSQLLGGFLASLTRTTIAYLCALIIAVGLAVGITSTPAIERTFLPFFDVMQSFPSFALFPILVHTLEHSPEGVILAVLTLEIIWPILFTVIGAMKNRRRDLEEAATMFGASGWHRLTSFTLPSLLPAIVTGSIVGWGEGWEVIIGAELLVSVHYGVGQYFGVLGNAGESGLLAGGIFVLMVLLFMINKLVWLPLLHDVTANQSES